MKDLKGWTATNASDKKQIKLIMQFMSFRKREVEDVGETGMNTKCPFDQLAVLNEGLAYIKSQRNVEDVGIGLVDDPELAIPERTSQQVSPGKPVLWMR
ncbi:hypothetical protein ACHAXR_000196 [Thalassiosira sp. AJA248-18]